MINPDLIIPPDSELGQRLEQLSGDSDDKVWEIARIGADLVEELEGGIVTRRELYRAMARRCRGRKVNTIRRWVELAMDYPLDIQKRYQDLLSFEHFKVSRRLFKDGRTPSIDYALQWAVEGNDDKITAGKFHTVGEMINHFLPIEAFAFTLPKRWNKVKEDLYDLFLMVDNDTKRGELLRSWQTIDSTVAGLTESQNAVQLEN